VPLPTESASVLSSGISDESTRTHFRGTITSASDLTQVMNLASLSWTTTDGANSPAVQLFAERAAAIEPGFLITSDNVATVAELCEHLDGMPLAIELAAARITVLTPAELMQGLSDRFNVLSGGRRRQRQRTLEAAVAWSYDLLEPEQQRVFRALGVFVGGFDLDAVAGVSASSSWCCPRCATRQLDGS
jgi:predicted ATPase